jgi:hypothetical protein
MTIIVKKDIKKGDEIIVYSEVNAKKYRRGFVETVKDFSGKIAGTAICLGSFGCNKKYTYTDEKGKRWNYGKFYFTFKMRGSNE